MSEDLYSAGLRIRRKVMGDAFVDRMAGSPDDFGADLQRMVNEWCWGASWARPGLELKQRSLNVLCILGALGRPHQFEAHFRGALRNGCTREELRETLLQIAVYAGIPAGVEAFKIAAKVLAEGTAPEGGRG